MSEWIERNGVRVLVEMNPDHQPTTVASAFLGMLDIRRTVEGPMSPDAQCRIIDAGLRAMESQRRIEMPTTPGGVL
jgi:hypothetical protein